MIALQSETYQEGAFINSLLPRRLDGSLCAFGRFSIMRTHIADKQQNNSPPGSEVFTKIDLT